MERAAAAASLVVDGKEFERCLLVRLWEVGRNATAASVVRAASSKSVTKHLDDADL